MAEMGKKLGWQKIKRILLVICSIMSVMLLGLPLLDGDRAAAPQEVFMEEGWRVYADGVEQGQRNALPYRLTEKVVHTIDLYSTIPETDFTVSMLSFVAYQKDVFVYVEDTLIYERVFSPTPFNLGFPGGGTCSMRLPEDSAGKEIHIQLKKVVLEDNGPITMVKISEGVPTPQTSAPKSLGVFVLMVSMFSVGIVLLVIVGFYRKLEINLVPLVYLALGLMSIAAWALCNGKMIEIFIDNWAFVHNLEYVSFYFMPVGIICFMEENWKGASKALHCMGQVLLVFFFVTLVCRAVFHVDFFGWITLFHSLIVVTFLVFLRELCIRGKGAVKSFRIMCAGAVILAVATVVELGQYYVHFAVPKSSVAQVFILGLGAFALSLLMSFILSTKEQMDASFVHMTQNNLEAEHRRYKMLMSNTKDIYMDWNLAEDTVYFSEQFEPYFGIPPYTQDVLETNKAFGEAIRFSKDLDDVFQSLVAGALEEELEGDFTDPQGEPRSFALTLSTVLDREKKPIHIIGIMHDITNERDLALEAAKQKEYLDVNEKLFDNILEADISEDRLLGKNAEALCERLLGRRDGSYSQVIEAVTKQLSHEDFADAYGEKLSRERLLSLFESGVSSFVYECRERSALGEYRWIRLNVRIFRSEISGTIRIISYVKDIEEEKQREVKLKNDSLLDSLTGILNKGGTRQKINEFLMADRGRTLCAFLMIDIDYFKTINDTLGHVVGDMVIGDIAQKLKKCVHFEDIVGRVGGDEFVVFMKEVPPPAVLEERLSQLCASFCETKRYEGKAYHLSISVGVSMYPSDGMTYDALYKNADVSLYASKDKGRNTYSFFGMT